MITTIAYHARILGKGFVRMLIGAATAGFIATSVYAFTVIPKEGGYAAVGDFLLAITCLVIAFCGVYIMGGSKKKGAKK